MKINRLNAPGYDNGLMTRRERKIVKGDWSEPAKDPLMVKSVFSLEHKDEKTVNIRTYLG